MQLDENVLKMIKIIVFAVLCAEMTTTFQCDQSRASNFNVEGMTCAAAATDAEAETSTLAAAPHYASIRLMAQERRGFGAGHICAGALVASSVVLTVANCLQSLHPAELRVILGTSDHYTPIAHTLNLGVTHIIRAPSMASGKGLDQLALLLLARDVPVSHTAVRHVPLLRVRRAPQAAEAPIHAKIPLNVTQMPLTHCGHVTHLTRYCLCMRHDSVADTRPLDAGAPLLAHNGEELLALKLHAGNSASALGAELYVSVGPHLLWLQAQIGDGSNQNGALWGTLGFVAFTAYAFGAGRRKVAY